MSSFTIGGGSTVNKDGPTEKYNNILFSSKQYD